MTEDAIKLIQELGFPVAVSIGCMGLLGWIVKYILKEKVEDTLVRFDEKHRILHESMIELKNDIEKIKKWNAEIKSDLKVYIDLSMKGK